MSLLERLWGSQRRSYPQGAYIPRRETFNPEILGSMESSMKEDKKVRRHTNTSLQSYRERRATIRRGHQPVDEWISTHFPHKESESVIDISYKPEEFEMILSQHDSMPPSVTTTMSPTLSSTMPSRPSTPQPTLFLPKRCTPNNKQCVLPNTPPSKAECMIGDRSRNEHSDQSDHRVRDIQNDSNLDEVSYLRQHNAKIHPVGATRHYPIVIQSELHRIMFDFCESTIFSGFILFIILLNTIMLVSQTSQVVQVRAVWYFACIDNIFLGIYLMELQIKIYAWRIRYFYVGWNWLDFIIVVFNVVDFLLPLVIANVGDFNGAAIFRLLRIFRAIRALRALRVLRTIRFLANLQVIMTTILQSIRSIGAIVMLIMLFMYMFAVIGRGLYPTVDPVRFGSLATAGFTLFQLLTLDDWFDIYSNAVAKDPSKWHIIIFLLAYIVVEYFIFLNLFVAVLVDNFHLTIEAQNELKKKRKLQDTSDDGEKDEWGLSEASESSIVSDISEEEDRALKGVEEHYSEMEENPRDQLKNYFQLRSSLEYNMHLLQDQHRVLRMMVDLCADLTTQEDQ